MNHEIHEAHEKAETLAEIVAEMRKRMKSYYYSREGRNLMRQYADRIEAVARRETAAAWIEGYNHAKRYFRPLTDEICRALPNPDPNWEEICAKCHDGEIEPDCEYYGEPNGCNSPICGEHPKSAPVVNSAALREALVAVKKSIDGIGASSLDCDPEILMASLTQVCARLSARIKAALAKPPRNCDVYDNESCRMAYHLHGDGIMTMQAFADWLFAPRPANEKGATDESK